VRQADSNTTTREGPESRSRLGPQDVVVDLSLELEKQFADALSPTVITRCVAAAIHDLRGSTRNEALPEMAARLALLRLDAAVVKTSSSGAPVRRIEPKLAEEPIENAEAKDPIQPMDRDKPTLPIDKIEFSNPIDKIEPSDRIEHQEPCLSQLTPTARERRAARSSLVLDGKSHTSEHLDGAGFAALEVTGGKPLNGSEFVRRTQDCLRRVAALLPDQLVRRSRGEAPWWRSRRQPVAEWCTCRSRRLRRCATILRRARWRCCQPECSPGRTAPSYEHTTFTPPGRPLARKSAWPTRTCTIYATRG
jgi:hypothetical protein